MVQEWLKVYLYSHVKRWLPRLPALLLVLVISSVEHDFMVSTGLGFFMPLYLVEYGIGGVCVRVFISLCVFVTLFFLCVTVCCVIDVLFFVLCACVFSGLHTVRVVCCLV